jgi:hypothetical protein
MALDGMDRDMKSLQNSLRQAKKGNSALAGKVSGLQNKIGALRAEVKKGNPKKKELAAARQELDKLRQENAIMSK